MNSNGTILLCLVLAGMHLAFPQELPSGYDQLGSGLEVPVVAIQDLILVNVNGYEVSICVNASCSGRCGVQAYQGQCFCDDMCMFNGDCCLDYEYECLGDANAAPLGGYVGATQLKARLEHLYEGRLSMQCVQVPTYSNTSMYIMMETRCPQQLPQELEDNREKCEDVNGSLSDDLVSNIPVLVDGIYYQNIYCAVCNGYDQSNISNMIEVMFDCPNFDAALTRLTDKSFESFLNLAMKTCKLYFDSETVSTRYKSTDRLCFEREGLGNMTTGLDLQSLCKLYRSDVMHDHEGRYKNVYRNPHCALLDKVNSNLFCHSDHDNAFISVPELQSFQVLLSLTDNSLSEVFYQERLICPGGSIFEPTNKTCLAISCNTGVRFGDKCVPFNLIGVQPLAFNRTTKFSILSKWEITQTTVNIFIILDTFYSLANIWANEVFGFSGFYINTQAFHHRCSFEQASPLETLRQVSNFETETTVLKKDECLQIGFIVNTNKNLPFLLIQDTMHYQNKGLGMLMANISSKLARHAILHSSFMVNYDYVREKLSCDANWQLIERQQISLSYKFGTTDSIVYSHQTGIIYKDSNVGLGLEVIHEDHHIKRVREFMLVCEAPILHCSTIKIFSGHDINDTLTFNYSGNFFSISQEYYIQLDTHQFAVCDYLLMWHEDVGNSIQGYMTVVGNSISISCLALTALTYMLFSSLQTVPGKCLLNLTISLMLAQLLFQLMPYAHDFTALCIAIGATDHYLFLVTFAWTSVLAFDSYKMFVKAGEHAFIKNDKRFVWYMVYAWGSPAPVVLTCVLLSIFTELPVSYHTENSCWIAGPLARGLSFSLPVAIYILINTTFFSLSANAIRKTSVMVQTSVGKESISMIYICIRFSSLMGFTWIFGFIANFKSLNYMVYPFIVLTTLQGLFICLSFVGTPRVRTMWKNALKLSSITKNPNEGKMTSMEGQF